MDVVNKAPVTRENVIRLISSLEGRDKLTKVTQYGSRFLAWYLLSNNQNDEWGLRIQKLYKASQQARKSFRFGKSFNEYHKVCLILEDKVGLLLAHVSLHLCLSHDIA